MGFIASLSPKAGAGSHQEHWWNTCADPLPMLSTGRSDVFAASLPASLPAYYSGGRAVFEGAESVLIQATRELGAVCA